MMQDVSGRLEIAVVCDDIKELLLEKNAKYGNSALNPVRIFSTESPIAQLLVRIDDKLSRIKRGAGLLAADEDVINDLIGYLVLLKVAMNRENTLKVEYEQILDFAYLDEDPTWQQYRNTDI
tara:strand:- start:3133 stop:3498 length:366 start_codon:yes stop_codon:yes gene_type:complete